MQTDDDLTHFAAQGAPPLPLCTKQGDVEHDGARIWYAAYGADPTVILLHGGLGHSGNWGYQLPTLLAAGYGVLLIDSRGHGRSTRDGRPYRYDRMADDLLAVMDALRIPHAALAGWSDGACVALIAAHRAPQRVDGVFFFGCNMDASGVKPPASNPIVERCFARHAQDYAALSPTPEEFDAFVAAVSLMMSSQPDYRVQELAAIRVPVTIVHSEHDEFIRVEHAAYLSDSIPGARLVMLPGVSHFAPLQRPAVFNRALLDFLADVMCRKAF
ncbi:alpha/beta fold hydrolase [Serratia sp. CY70267]|uniref:alpha/beta fold hydrolase n=1 Tax=unclassified Serratia (in: enterobacteria) TaxID=2647522 RepID=UPI001EEF33B0|nr:alpha/beta hydrolase [Serratia marcescens]